MRRLWILMAGVVAFGGLAAFAPATGASTPAAPDPKFCTAINNIGDTSSAADAPTGAQAKQAATTFKAAAKFAPAKVKAAMLNIASYLKKVGTIKKPEDLAKVYESDGFKSYGKSIVTYATYAIECATSGT
jgi:hypothetical protein